MEINTINLVGRAGREPDVRYFESGSIVANFTIAVNRRSRDEEPDWFNLEIWGKQAQIAADYVKKGSLIGITGSFKIDSWKDKNTGEDRFKPVIRVDRLNLLSSRKESENNQYSNSNNSLPEGISKWFFAATFLTASKFSNASAGVSFVGNSTTWKSSLILARSKAAFNASERPPILSANFNSTASTPSHTRP